MTICNNSPVKYGEKILVIPNFDIRVKNGDGLINFINDYDFKTNKTVIKHQHDTLFYGLAENVFSDEINMANMIIVPPIKPIIEMICMKSNINFVVELRLTGDSSNFTIFNDLDIATCQTDNDNKLLSIPIDYNALFSNKQCTAKCLKAFIYTSIINKIINNITISNRNFFGYISINGFKFSEFYNVWIPNIKIINDEKYDDLLMNINVDNDLVSKTRNPYTAITENTVSLNISNIEDSMIKSISNQGSTSNLDLLVGDLQNIQFTNIFNRNDTNSIIKILFDNYELSIHYIRKHAKFEVL